MAPVTARTPRPSARARHKSSTTSEHDASSVERAGLRTQTKKDGKAPGPFKCPNCPRICRQKADLKRHEKEKHLFLRDFECIECRKTFTRKSTLTAHQGKCNGRLASADEENAAPPSVAGGSVGNSKGQGDNTGPSTSREGMAYRCSHCSNTEQEMRQMKEEMANLRRTVSSLRHIIYQRNTSLPTPASSESQRSVMNDQFGPNIPVRSYQNGRSRTVASEMPAGADIRQEMQFQDQDGGSIEEYTGQNGTGECFEDNAQHSSSDLGNMMEPKLPGRSGDCLPQFESDTAGEWFGPEALPYMAGHSHTGPNRSVNLIGFPTMQTIDFDNLDDQDSGFRKLNNWAGITRKSRSGWPGRPHGE